MWKKTLVDLSPASIIAFSDITSNWWIKLCEFIANCQIRQNFPPPKISTIWYTVFWLLIRNVFLNNQVVRVSVTLNNYVQVSWLTQFSFNWISRYFTSIKIKYNINFYIGLKVLYSNKTSQTGFKNSLKHKALWLITINGWFKFSNYINILHVIQHNFMKY